MTEEKVSRKRTLIGKVVSDKRAKTVTVLKSQDRCSESSNFLWSLRKPNDREQIVPQIPRALKNRTACRAQGPAVRLSRMARTAPSRTGRT